MSEIKCHICNNNTFSSYFKHVEWKKQTLKCNNCNHVALYNSKKNIQSSKNFSTNKNRAVRYLSYLKNLEFNSLLEIGTPTDFYFLKQLHKIKPKCELYSFDIFKKSNIPNYLNCITLDKTYTDDADITIDLLDKLKDRHFDLIYATHVLEHIPNINVFINILKHTNYFIFEIPIYNDKYFNKALNEQLTTTSYHYQFFNKENTIKFFKKHNIKCWIYLIDVKTTPFNKGNITITNYDCSFSKDYRKLL